VFVGQPGPVPIPDRAYRRQLDQLLGSLRPFDRQEAADLGEACAWVGRGEPLWRVGHPGDPGGPSPHLVVYTVVIDADLGALYLVENRRAQRWMPSGGHVRPEEHPADAAVRKLAEELGVQLPFLDGLSSSPLFLTITDTVGPTPHRDVSLWFVFGASVTTGLAWDDSQVVQARWWTFDEIRSAHPSSLHPSVVRFIGKLEAVLD
jgi:8-oxo-dGTP diphosphatase